MAASLIAKLADRVREDLPDFKSQLYRIFLDSFFKERTIQIQKPQPSSLLEAEAQGNH